MKKWKVWQIALFTALCVLLNIGGRQLAGWFRLPMWLDSFGTVLCACIAGPLGGAMVGLTSNLAYSVVVRISVAYSITNIVLDPVFILVFKWGVAGAAIATVIGNILSCTFYITYVHRRAAVISLEPKRALAAPGEIFLVAALGFPNAASTILSGFASTFSNNLLARHGTDAIAARAAAGKASMLISMVQMGICMGVQPLMAYSYGSKDFKRLREVIQKVALLTVSIGLGTLLICFTFRRFIIGLFLKEAAVAAMGERFMLYVMAGAPFLGLVYISTNFLQATKKATSAIIVSLLRQGLLLIPLLYIMHAVMGFYGIAAAHMIADIGAALIAAVIFFVEFSRVRKELA